MADTNNTPVVNRPYLSPNEVAEMLGVSPFTIRRYIKMGELKAVKLLGGFRVHRDNLDAFLKAHEVNPSEEELTPAEIASNHSSAASPVTLPIVASEQVATSRVKTRTPKSRRAARRQKSRT
jgi:excisionase family DNA binding protein